MGRLAFSDADQVVIMAAGVKIVGWADGEFCTVEQVSDGFTDVVGTDGEVVRSKTNDRRTTVTLKLLQTSISNDILSAVHNADIRARNGRGVFPFQIIDLQGTTVVHAAQAWIVKAPDTSFDRSAKTKEWQIRLAEATRFDGGNVI